MKYTMETLGQLRVQREVGYRVQGGGNPSLFAWLNFDQVAFLLTLTKTTELTIKYRLKLILAFKQARVDPHQPYMFEHSAWLKPYVAGFYAHKYEGKSLARDEVILRLDDLLAHERLA